MMNEQYDQFEQQFHDVSAKLARFFDQISQKVYELSGNSPETLMHYFLELQGAKLNFDSYDIKQTKKLAAEKNVIPYSQDKIILLALTTSACTLTYLNHKPQSINPAASSKNNRLDLAMQSSQMLTKKIFSRDFRNGKFSLRDKIKILSTMSSKPIKGFFGEKFQSKVQSVATRQSTLFLMSFYSLSQLSTQVCQKSLSKHLPSKKKSTVINSSN